MLAEKLIADMSPANEQATLTKILKAYEPMVGKFVYNHRLKWGIGKEEDEDLRQVARMGVVIAARNYRPRIGVKGTKLSFVSWAWIRIRHELQKASRVGSYVNYRLIARPVPAGNDLPEIETAPEQDLGFLAEALEPADRELMEAFANGTEKALAASRGLSLKDLSADIDRVISCLR